MNDSHYKVQQKSQNATYILFLNFEKLSNKQRNFIIGEKLFESLLERILTNLTDKKREVSESALRLIDKMRKIFLKDFLALRTLNTLDIQNPRAKIAAFEFLASIVKETGIFISQTKTLKKLIKKCIFYLNQNSGDTNFIGPILSIILCLRDLDCEETVKNLTSGNLSFSEVETLESNLWKYAPDLIEDISVYKKSKKPVLHPNLDQMDRSKYCKSIDQVPYEVIEAEKKMCFKSKDFTDEKVFEDVTNFTPEGYSSISLMKRVNKLKKIAKIHIKSQSVER